MIAEKDHHRGKSHPSRRRAVLAAAGLLCLSQAVCSCASVDPARKESIDRVFDQSGSETRLNGARADWQPGQWVLLRVVSDGVRSLRRITVREKEGSAFWIEVHDIEPAGDAHTLFLIDGFDPDSPRRLRVLRAKLQTGDETLEVNGDELDGPRGDKIRERSTEFLARLRHLQALGRKRDTTVAAGTFKDTRATPISITRVIGTWTGFVWYTNAVPVIYYARSEMKRTLVFDLVTSRAVEEVADFGSSDRAVAHDDRKND